MRNRYIKQLIVLASSTFLLLLTLIGGITVSQADEIHPRCLDEFYQSNWDELYDVGRCQRDSIDIPYQTESMPRYDGGERDVYVYHPDDHDSWLAYAIPFQKDDIWVFEYIYNGGGTGQFSTIFVARLTEELKLEMLAHQYFGDRCDDGGAQVLASRATGDPQTIVATHATPFKLLNPANRQDWRRAFLKRSLPDNTQTVDEIREEYGLPALFNNWTPFTDIHNSAATCAGLIHWRYNSDISDW